MCINVHGVETAAPIVQSILSQLLWEITDSHSNYCMLIFIVYQPDSPIVYRYTDTDTIK